MTQSQLTDLPESQLPHSNAVPAYEGPTSRKDNWWVEPFLIAFVFTAFGIYSMFRAFENGLYETGPYLSPFYSPNLKEFTPWWPLSPAFLILWIPLSFRATCYYYRKAYYRSYFMHPPACTVGMFKGKGYTGEQSFPFVLQNLHRYAFYLATPVLLILWWDAVKTLYYDGGFHLSVLTVVMIANCVLLSGYTFGCHACRHIVGGKEDCFSCPTNESKVKPAFQAWQLVTKFNERHQQWAWTSLFSVALTDLYIRYTCVDPNLAFQLF